MDARTGRHSPFLFAGSTEYRRREKRREEERRGEKRTVRNEDFTTVQTWSPTSLQTFGHLAEHLVTLHSSASGGRKDLQTMKSGVKYSFEYLNIIRVFFFFRYLFSFRVGRDRK